MNKNPRKERSTTAGAIRSQRYRDELTPGYVRSLLAKSDGLTGEYAPPWPVIRSMQAVLGAKRMLRAVAEGDQEKIKKCTEYRKKMTEGWAKEDEAEGRTGGVEV